MSVPLNTLVEFLDSELEVRSIPGDSSVNGLQVQGNKEVRKAAFGVDACSAFFAEAAHRGADFAFSHHGLFWGAGLKRITGPMSDRMAILFRHGISYYAVHLPLDAHKTLGNNAAIASLLDFKETWSYGEYAGAKIGVAGRLARPMSLSDLATQVETGLNALIANAGIPGARPRVESSKHVHGDPESMVETVGVVSGSAGEDGIIGTTLEKLDCLVTGEFKHSSYHCAMETGLRVISLGHYRTEVGGPIRVMERVRQHFGLDCEFIDLPTGL